MQPWYLNWMFWAYAFVWLPFFLFVVFYAARSPWRSSAVGRGMMILGVSLTGVLTFVMVVIAVPLPDEAKDLLRGATLGSIALAGWLQLKNLLVLQKQRHTEVDHPLRRSTDVP